MLVAVLQPDKLAAFNITTLEQDMRQDLLVEPDLGIPISLLDTERYAVPDHKPPLAPEDAALLAVRHMRPHSKGSGCTASAMHQHLSSPCMHTSRATKDVAAFIIMWPQGPSTGGGEGITGPSPGKTRERLRGEGTELSWLMRTTYIAPDVNTERKQAAAAATPTGDADLGTADLDAQIAEIEVPLHPSQ